MKSDRNRINFANLKIDSGLYHFVNEKVIPESGINAEEFWTSLSNIVDDLEPINKSLLDERDSMQAEIDQWFNDNKTHDVVEQTKFLEKIGYIEPPIEDFKIQVDQVDDEISHIAGPQLVVPVSNSRFILNACNARWGSLYKALYGTDVILEEHGCKRTRKYNPVRGRKVTQYARDFLDRAMPLAIGSHSYVIKYTIKSGNLVAIMGDGSTSYLGHRERFVGYTGELDNPDSILLKKNNLHIDVKIGEGFFIGKGDLAGVYDIQMESALTTIMDCEDSVAAVDAEDKINIYNNWLGLMRGDLKLDIVKNGKSTIRVMNEDKTFTSPDGKPFTLPGRSLMLLRNVGIHMYTDSVLTSQGKQIPEGFLDAMITVLIAKHDLLSNSKFTNSKKGSVYIVKPKLHGSKEVNATAQLFERVEDALKLERNTIKIGVMDEERRTTVNLSQCIEAVKNRIIFINTGFLDRTGDEIHTCMQAGVCLPKERMKTARWLMSYEDWNVDIGLKYGFQGVGQIGKGMWAAPDNMAQMVETKVAHPRAGANTAWVPSPIAATLHAMHYHRVNLTYRQQQLARHFSSELSDILEIPIIDASKLGHREIRNELENNAQSILGYVVRWINQGIGCSKVPDINDVPLMEDRATLRISSQLLANWHHHGLITKKQIKKVFKDMAMVVDWQNQDDPQYIKMHPNLDDSLAYQAALDLVFKGRNVANGYTEPVLHHYRRKQKELLSPAS